MKNIYLLLVAFVVAAFPSVVLGAYGGGSASSVSLSSIVLQKDDCPDGDYSPSFYDGDCGVPPYETLDEQDEAVGVLLRGVVFDDLNGNGVQDNREPGFPGVLVTLKNQEGVTVDTAVSATSGMYEFHDIMPGSYVISFTLSNSVSQSFYRQLLALFVPSVSAATYYEFPVTVSSYTTAGESQTLVSIPVVDGEINVAALQGVLQGSTLQSDTQEEDGDDHVSFTTQGASLAPTNSSITSIIRGNNPTTLSATSVPTSPNQGIVLPAFLPNTGATVE